MSDDRETTKVYRRNHTKEAVARIAKCINACDGVDDAILDILARKNDNNKTVLQRILDRIDWSGAHKTIEDEPG